MTGVPRNIAEHGLNVNPALKLVVQKRRGMAPDRVKWLCEEIPMAQEDINKTAFHTGKDIFSYIVMPFGLINTGATYQRLIDTAFEKQIGRNLEAYVDDLVIKSTAHERIIEYMRGTFDTLQRINMKLNPLKCSFGETEGKFLGYLVTEQGIQANPKKIAAIENMTAPRTIKEVKSLTGKLAALTRFLSKAAKRQLPFFKTLKGCLKQKSFVWSSDAEAAFQEMKKLLKTLHTLTAPIDGEILYLYISVAKEAFGSVLIVEREKIQKPVYFISKALTGSEINYAPIEKFVYALILTSLRLRRYFQGHPVHVLTNMSIKQVLTKPEISGRLALWVVELGAYQISYLPRSAVKGQVMADYLSEIPRELEVINERTALKPVMGETWDLFTDGVSCAEGVGAGLVLASPNGEEHTYALRFNFDVTNNEAEYEAILAGLNITQKMNIIKLRAFTDLQLVANQFNGSFEAHDSSMQKYLQLLKELAERFEHFELVQVPRSQNKKADASSKLAALTFSHFQKQVWVEELPSKSIDNDLVVAYVIEEQPNWMEPILQYIHSKVLPSDKRESRLVRERAPMYIIQNDILYRKLYCGPMMQCVGPVEAEMIVDDVHNGSCALHSGPFPAGPGNVKFLIVAIDYFTKWVEDKAVRTITAIPAKILVPKHRVANFEEEANDDALRENLNFIEERRLIAAIREANNKQQIAKYYNKRVRALSFDIGEWVLRNNDASRAEKLGKLGPN
ncbi:uncharacterized protein [Rutidosis leptorrhynchoides]|uniref:uncharacterized protein n=1 Tax=Rutidosis leptorrhynchoides TaxID=125765 RepID=UPI003A99C6BA